MAPSEEMVPRWWGFDSGAACRILSYPGSWRQVSLHIHHLQLLAGGEAEADGSSDYSLGRKPSSFPDRLAAVQALVEDAGEAGRLACWGPLEEN